MSDQNVIGAFSEEQASAISGVSLNQLRRWAAEGFFSASYASDQPHVPYSRIYSFRDLVSLQVLNDLRNHKKIPLAHLREVSAKLAHLGDRRWIATTLYVLGRRVVFDNPSTDRREEIVSGQRVFNIPLRIVARHTKQRIRDLNNRQSQIGQFDRRRFVSGNRKVFAGTRIPVEVILDFMRAGFADAAILSEYPDLSEGDLEAARQAMLQAA